MQSPTIRQTLGEPAYGFYREALERLNEAGIDFMVGGAYASGHYTGILRDTKDFDIFVRPDDCRRVLDLFAEAGFHTELTFPHWLGKVYWSEYFVDVIFSSGNGVARVDDDWFAHAQPATVLDMPVHLIPVEEMIWSKGFVVERERYDGADVNHVLRARAAQLDWKRLLQRFGPHWRVLFSQVVLFGFGYPGERTQVPEWVMRYFIRRLESEAQTAGPKHLCRGTLLSREQYLVDIEEWGYQDARLLPHEYMSSEDIEHWTAAISAQK